MSAAGAPVPPFLAHTGVRAVGGGRYAAAIDRSWWIIAGPNGGYVAAIVLRAVVAEVADPARRPRSATFHFLRPPAEGPVEVQVTVERVGRSVSNVAARMTQDGRTLVTALVALGADRDAPTEFDDDSGLPIAADGSALPGPQELAAGDVDPERDVPMRSHYDMRWALGDLPFRPGPGARAHVGGWLRLLGDVAVDEVVLTAMSDAWLPPIFSRLALPLAVPTVDLTVHFRGLPAEDSGWCFVEFDSPVSRDGYLVEHGALRDRTGRLLAESRQLAIVI